VKLSATLLLALCAPPAPAAWLRLTTPNFELFTDAGDQQGRQAMIRLERIRSVFGGASGVKPVPRPVRVFVFKSEREFRAFRPSESATGFFQGGPDRNYIAMHGATGETLRGIHHEYVHMVLNHSAAALPQWFEEGLAEFYSTIDKRGEDVLIGSPVDNHIRTLLLSQWIDARTFIGVTKRSPLYNERDTAGLFYAQSWAMVHMLNMSSPYRRMLPRFAELLDKGYPPDLAFQQAFHVTPQNALDDCKSYVRAKRFTVAQVFHGPDAPVEIGVEPVPDSDAALVRLDLLLALGRDEEAAKRIDALRDSGVLDSADGLLARALLALHRNRKTEAETLLEQARTKGSRRAEAWFESAMLARERGAPRDEVRSLLGETVGRNPKHAEAQFLLGLMESQDGRHREAIAPLEQAAAILPRQSYFWHALAIAYHHLHRTADARLAARRAAESASTEAQLDMARAALKLVGESPAPPPSKPKQDVIVPPAWTNRRGEATVTGILEHIDCMGPSARFQIRVDGHPMMLFIDRPGEVLLETASAVTFDFACGAQRPRRVSIGYTPRADPARKTEGDIRAIEFPD
jgi:tetratricopeptide (TPR) repeat protein